MSPAPAMAGNVAEAHKSDKRTHQRYPISLDLEYKLLHRGQVQGLGFGRTVNISSGGVLIEVIDIMPRGRLIELVVNWPFLLEGVCPLKLIVHGRVVRTDGRAVAVKAKHHEFRTAGVRIETSRTDNKVRSSVK
jgi:PilZ domain